MWMVRISNFPTNMPIVKVKEKFQVTLPAAVREEAGLAVGDLLEAKMERGRITLIPKTLIDRRIAESLEDFKKGRVYGPFASVGAMAKSLRGSSKKARRRSSE